MMAKFISKHRHVKTPHVHRYVVIHADTGKCQSSFEFGKSNGGQMGKTFSGFSHKLICLLLSGENQRANTNTHMHAHTSLWEYSGHSHAAERGIFLAAV